MGFNRTDGLWVVLGWVKKPKHLGTGMYWGTQTVPAPYATAEKALQQIAAFAPAGHLRLWPVR